MKRLFTIVLLLAACQVFSQANVKQDKGTFPKLDLYTVFAADSTIGDSTFIGSIQKSDTLSSEVYRTQHYMTLKAAVVDSGSTDSVAVAVDLYQGMLEDGSDMMYVKRLSWTNAAGTASASDSLTAIGNWWTDIGSSAFTNMPYWMAKIVGLTTNKKLTGVKGVFTCTGEKR